MLPEISTSNSLPQIIWSRHQHSNSHLQCDCACADIDFQSQAQTPDTLNLNLSYRVTRGLHKIPLTQNWDVMFRPGSQFIPVLVNSSAYRFLSCFSSPQLLGKTYQRFPTWNRKYIDVAFHNLVVSELVAPQGWEFQVPAKTIKTLTVWLHVTNSCNLQCSYCYLDKTARSMSFEIGRRAIDAVIRSALRHGYTRILLKYAGGEPTLNLSVVLDLHDYATSLARAYNLHLDEVLLSNGTLITSARLNTLKAKNIRLMISLDGLGNSNDVQRSFSNGNGSFSIVSNNIKLALECGLTPEISITISNLNLDGLADTVTYLLNNRLPFTLNFYRDSKCSTSIDRLQLSEQRIVDAMLGAYKAIEENLPSYSLLGCLLDRASFLGPHDNTCGVGQDYMVIDEQGNISKCQMAITEKVTDVNSGDPLGLIREDQHGVQNYSVDRKEGCRECVWKHWCAGGCPLSTYRATGRYDTRSPNCNIYKTLYPEVLRLEALRLMKNQLLIKSWLGDLVNSPG